MKKIGCYSDAQRQDIDNNTYWACPARTPLNEDEKLKRESNSFSNELIRIEWEPSWEPEDTREAWPNFHQCILQFEACKDEPDFSIPAADFELDNLERQGFENSDKTNAWKQKLDTELRNKATFDMNPTKPQVHINGTGRCEFWITTVDLIRPKPSNATDPNLEQMLPTPLPCHQYHLWCYHKSIPNNWHAFMAEMENVKEC